ncbi:UNVERIFIED_CONTAM: hypothetical protein GTU68_038810 [Idotea baltica]|nr:hypothetical protein [Idotea baltica]
MVVITGVSGSGKSSLAFDTIYAEGQRRYMESFSAYARQFMGGFERPDVEKIDGLSPVISIEQKTTSRNPRSTVGTVTEIYDFIRLLYARIGEAYSYNTGKKMVRFTESEIIDLLFKKYADQKISLLAPVVKGRKGHYRELFVQIQKQGYTSVRIDGEIQQIREKMQLDRYKIHDIEIVIDRLKVTDKFKSRLIQSINTAFKSGKGLLMVHVQETGEVHAFSKKLMCIETGIAYDEPSPNSFSFNSPYGYCKGCKGLGFTYAVDMDLVQPDDNLSIENGGIAALGEVRDNYTYKLVKKIAKKFKFTLKTPVNKIPREGLEMILYGSKGKKFRGIVNTIERFFNDSESEYVRRWSEQFMSQKTCETCNGNRLKKESLHFKLDDKNIAEVTKYDIIDLYDWFTQLDNKLNKRQQTIANDLLKEIRERIQFLIDVGLTYLSLDRPSKTLSGGESQRIRLATQIGSQLVGITYILDEPSIGLHQRDNERLINSLRKLADSGNTVLVVEHDKDIMLASDFIIDLGPGAGMLGGEIVAAETPENFLKLNTETAAFLSNKKMIEIPKTRRKGNGEFLKLKGATGNNLKSVNADFPLGTLICVTGVSGSGKSTLVNETLYPILRQYFYKSKKKPLAYKSISGLEHLDKVIEIDQSPIGRTPRSNPATYIKLFDEIRKLFTLIPEAQIRGYKAGRFSFNVAGGRCEECKGGGVRVIEMNFLPDVHVQCETCLGKRYNRETLEVRYKGKSIADILDMTVEEGCTFFESIPKIYRKLITLKNVGLGYITLGQQATTLSGGEAQRVKLSAELSKRATGQTFYILDEPTTGLHFKDIKMLLGVIQKLVDKGNTVLIIEHNLDVVKVADYIIDIGPEGGAGGGTIVTKGTPEKVAKSKKSHTARFLLEELK